MWLGTKNCITVTLDYIYMTTNISPGNNFLFAALRAPCRSNQLCCVHSALVLLRIYSMLLGVFWPAHFFNTACALCVFACPGHRNRHLKDGSYLYAALCTMTSTLTDLTATSTAFAPCTSSTGSLMSSLSSLWIWLFSSIWDHKSRSTHHRFYSRSKVWAALSDVWYCCGRPAHLSHHHSVSDRND